MEKNNIIVLFGYVGSVNDHLKKQKAFSSKFFKYGGGGSAGGYHVLRTFVPIVSAHPYCACNSLRNVMPRHVLSVRAVEEMWRYIALVGTLISMHGFNSLKCSVTPYFLLIDHFLCRLSTFFEKLKKICIVEV